MSSPPTPDVIRITALSLLLLVSACGGGGGGSGKRSPPAAAPPAPPPEVVTVAATSPYVSDARYAAVLRECTYAGSDTRACSQGTLPFLGREFADPTVDDVLSRTLVSDRWMGRNFADALRTLPADLLPLFRSVTAVVIARDVRPARYRSATGAIYLDPEFLWLSVAERDSVSDEPDPRSGFGLDLRFQMPWRYVRDDQPLTVFINPDGSRDLDQIREILAYLLYHELAHAVDFVPPDRLPMIRDDETVRTVVNRLPPLSVAFQNALPLHSSLLEGLAAVSFLGEPATPAQRALAPDDLIPEFVNDGATQYYAYTSSFEDFATLFESAMMKWHFGYDKDTAITDRPASGRSNDAVVAWGTRGRLGEHVVQARVRSVGERIYPGALADFEAFLDAQGEPQRMRAGDTWGENLVLTPAQPAAQRAGTEARQPDIRRRDYFLERVRIH